MAKSTIYTFGYEKRQPEELVAEAERLSAVVVDVRIKPFNRRSDWGRSHLMGLLGDRYRWVAGFGNVNYKGGPVELADPKACHRSWVAEWISKRIGNHIEHLIREGTQPSLL